MPRPGTCHRCGIEYQFLQRHHKISRTEGGPDTEDNIELLCPNCHFLHHGGIGGDNPLSRTPEARAKKSKTFKRLWSDPEYRAKMEPKRQEAANKRNQNAINEKIRSAWDDPAKREAKAEAMRKLRAERPWSTRVKK